VSSDIEGCQNGVVCRGVIVHIWLANCCDAWVSRQHTVCLSMFGYESCWIYSVLGWHSVVMRELVLSVPLLMAQKPLLSWVCHFSWHRSHSCPERATSHGTEATPVLSVPLLMAQKPLLNAPTCLAVFSWHPPLNVVYPCVKLFTHSLALRNELLMKNSLTVRDSHWCVCEGWHFGHGGGDLLLSDNCCLSSGYSHKHSCDDPLWP
jgi:hypothetical protein